MFIGFCTLVGNWLGSVVDNLSCFIDHDDGEGKFVQNMGNYTDVHSSASQQASVFKLNIFTV